jgi:hypothetical protein
MDIITRIKNWHTTELFECVETGDNLDKVTSDETEDNLEFYWEDGVKKLRQNK